MRRCVHARRVSAAVLLLGACASLETGTPADVAGRWDGRCSDCPVSAFALVLVQDGGRLTGILQASGRSGLGQRELPLNGEVTGRVVAFRVVGADGVALDARLHLSADARTLEGRGRHRADFDLVFTRGPASNACSSGPAYVHRAAPLGISSPSTQRDRHDRGCAPFMSVSPAGRSVRSKNSTISRFITSWNVSRSKPSGSRAPSPATILSAVGKLVMNE